MVNGLKKLDKKFLIMAGSIILLPILIIVILACVRGCGGGTTTPEKYEQKMISAAEKYFEAKKLLPKKEGEVATVELKKLVSDGYIKSTEKLLKDASCSGEVTVRRNGSTIEKNDGGFLNYVVDLVCDEYKTTHLVDKILKNAITTTENVAAESGLYKVDETYIFKGDQVENYINFYGLMYRIMSIDENGIIKLIRTEPEINSRIWDNKFNAEVNRSYGKNIYKDSQLLMYLLNDYDNPKKFTTESKQHVVSYDVCIGKRTSNDYSINRELDCAEILENQVVSVMNVSDFALASSDPDCNSTISRSCKNYNYLSKIATSTWTSNSLSDNTYEVFYISDGVSSHQNANAYNEYNIVIYIDGQELYVSGKGTSSNPYVLGVE